MAENFAVIGANYGDEGKGHITDYLSTRDSLVIRYNGGAQAGHTVVTPDGDRHVFHHLGSGTFQGATTFLSRFFVVNPIRYVEETKALRAAFDLPKVRVPEIRVDREALVSTPYDALLNMAIESHRGHRKHGSCGMGINETIVRSETEHRLTVSDLIQRPLHIEERLHKIRTEYVPKRVRDLGISVLDIPLLLNDGLLHNFLRDCIQFIETTHIEGWGDYGERQIHSRDRFIFEGAQGLRLDMDAPDFPHVTRSKTGLQNVIKLMEEATLDPALSAYYVTRPYLTRHGAGPLKGELGMVPWPRFKDDTNVPNEHQGDLRFAHLDLMDMRESVFKDWSKVLSVKVTPKLALTCLDHTDYIYSTYREEELLPDEFVTLLQLAVGFQGKSLISCGPKRNDIEEE